MRRRVLEVVLLRVGVRRRGVARVGDALVARGRLGLVGEEVDVAGPELVVVAERLARPVVVEEIEPLAVDARRALNLERRVDHDHVEDLGLGRGRQGKQASEALMTRRKEGERTDAGLSTATM